MMSELIHGITDEGESTFQATLQGDYDIAKPILDLSDAEDLTDGILSENLDSAYVLARFLLEHQEAGLLPPIVELSDVIAAYEGGLERFAELKKEKSA